MTAAEHAALRHLEGRLSQARAERDRLYGLITPVLLTIVNKNLPTSPDAALVRHYREACAAFERAKSDLDAFHLVKLKPGP